MLTNERNEKEEIILNSLYEISKSKDGISSLKKISEYINNLITDNTVNKNIVQNYIEFDNNDFLVETNNKWRNISINIIDGKNTVIDKIHGKINPFGDIVEIINNGQKIQYFTVTAAIREIKNKNNGWRLPTFKEWQNNKNLLTENIRYNGFIGLGGNRLFDSELSDISNPKAHFWTSDIANRRNEYLSIIIPKNKEEINKYVKYEKEEISNKYGRLQGLYLSIRLVKDKV